MKYTVNIKDNETGEMLVNEQCNVIIGGISSNGDTNVVVLSACSPITMAGCVVGVTKLIKRILTESPETKLLTELEELLEKKKEGANNE